MREQVDVVVIGMGVGGEEVAGRLAQAGLAVVGVEDRLVGGECPYWGCVPTKMMIRAADLIAEAGRVPGLAGEATVRPDWAQVARRIREEATDSRNDQVAADRFTGKGGRFVRGRATITAPGEVSVGDRVFGARRGIVIATGAAPTAPPIPGLADVPYWTNREAVETEQLPRSLAIIGGGAVGVEFAQVYARFGWASPSSKRPTGCSHSRSPKPALSSRTRSPPTASPFAPVRGSPRCVTTEGCSPSTSTPASRSTRSGCW